jgi:ABC-type glycerol-3-phosphate transport system substrate-binding protein
MSNPDSPHHQISEELARFLTEAEFMGEWTLAAGYLPVRPESLAAWPERSDTAFAGRVLLSAAPIPPLDILETSGPLIRDTLKDLWDGNVTLMDAAEGVLP